MGYREAHINKLVIAGKRLLELGLSFMTRNLIKNTEGG